MLRARVRDLTPLVLTEWFAAGNLGFLAVDILLAHEENAFARRTEWVPVIFSCVAALLLAPGLTSARLRERLRPVGMLVGVGSIAVGIAGMMFHLESAFFERQSLHNLVYTAPFVAPLSYVGLGLLLVLNRMEAPNEAPWAGWVLLLSLGGFVGNLGLSLLDHAQNGFFTRLEWIPVAAAAFAVSFLLVALLHPIRPLLRIALAVMSVEALVGLLGLVLHLAADLRRPSSRLEDRLVYGAPVFAPMLFADLALLAAIAIWALLRAPERQASAEPLATAR